MQNFHDNFETRKRSFISAISVRMNVPLMGKKVPEEIYIQKKKVLMTSGNLVKVAEFICLN